MGRYVILEGRGRSQKAARVDLYDQRALLTRQVGGIAAFFKGRWCQRTSAITSSDIDPLEFDPVVAEKQDLRYSRGYSAFFSCMTCSLRWCDLLDRGGRGLPNHFSREVVPPLGQHGKNFHWGREYDGEYVVFVSRATPVPSELTKIPQAPVVIADGGPDWEFLSDVQNLVHKMSRFRAQEMGIGTTVVPFQTYHSSFHVEEAYHIPNRLVDRLRLNTPKALSRAA